MLILFNSVVISQTAAPCNVTIVGDNMYTFGDQIKLTCLLDSGPDLEYSWSRSGAEEFPAETITDTNTLTISAAVGGDYTCTVTNNIGSDSATVTVYSKFEVWI